MAVIDGGAGNDSLAGNDNVADTINGLEGNDTLYGGLGNVSDTLDGGSGVDSMNGGDGSDTYIVDNVGDVCAESFNDAFGGIADTVFASVSYTISGLGIENLTLTGAALTGTGNANNNIIIGNSLNNTLSGLLGNDTLDGGFGFDTLDGGDGSDTVDYRFWNFGLTVNLATGVASFEGNVPTESLTSIESILAGNANDSITGSTADNNLNGGGGNDTLDGGAGNDTLVGGLGDDALTGGTGVDNLSGGDGNDGFLMNGTTNVAGWIVDGGAGTDVADLVEGTLQLGTTLPFVNVEQLDVWQTTFAGTAGADTYDFRPFATIGFGVGQAVQLNAGDGNDVVYTSNSVPDLGGAHAVDGQNGNDTLTGGTARDSLSGGANDDVLFGGGGNDTLIGGDGNDALNGASGSNDSLSGGNGNDTLNGGGGNDSASGGEGDDFVFAVFGTDTADGGNGNDTLDTTSWSGDYVVNLATGLTNFLGESYVAFENLISGAGNDSLTGSTGVNRILGGAGNDTIDGGAGADTMEGGTGNDTYIVDDASDVTTETSSVATERDTVLASVTRTLGANLENLTLTGAANINGVGNGLANLMIGNGGANALNAGAGVDTLDGGLGADTMDGGDQNDLYIVDNIADVVGEFYNDAGGGNDTVESSASYSFDGLTPNQRGYGLENLVLTGTSDLDGSGNGNDNGITGNSGDNRLDGGAGADTLTGGDGDDELDGANGDDTLGDGAGSDTLSGGSGDDTLASDAGDDLLAGGAGNDSLVSTAGFDVLVGGAGNDTYLVEDGGDLVVETVDGGVDTVQSAAGITLAANLENAQLLGSAAVGVTGNALANTITGNAAANGLDGGAGNDTLTGNAGNDTLTGAAGNDSMSGGDGNDAYSVDSLSDVVNEAGTVSSTLDKVTSTVTWSLNKTGNLLVERLVLGGTAANGTGNALANTITGNASANRLNGGAGNDTLIGNAGNDTLTGAAGNDSMAGGDGNDAYSVDSLSDIVSELGTASSTLDTVTSGVTWSLNKTGNLLVERLVLGGTAANGTGNALANTITGNASANVLNGLGGNDVLSGGLGNDTFAFTTVPNSTTNADRISDFSAGGDRIQLENAVFTQLAATGGLGAANFRSNATGTAVDANDYVLYDNNGGQLYYDADGSGAGARILLATLGSVPGLQATDIFIT